MINKKSGRHPSRYEPTDHGNISWLREEGDNTVSDFRAYSSYLL